MLDIERPSQQYDPTAHWGENPHHDPSKYVTNPDKAAHEAVVEDAWRTAAREAGAAAVNAANSDNPMAGHGAQHNYDTGRYLVVDGKKAVEATGQAYDALHSPQMPPQIDWPVQQK